MKKFRFLSWLLCLSLLFATLAVPGTAALAEDATDEDNGMKFTKTAEANDNGTYTITLEAYATGSKVITDITEDVPTDIILVLDQSGSMAEEFSKSTEEAWVSYGYRSNGENYEDRVGGNNNLYYKLPDGGYVEVSVSRTNEWKYTYTAQSSQTTNSSYYNNRDRLYEDENGSFKVTVDRSNNGSNRTYTYRFSDGSVESTGASNYPDLEGRTIYLRSQWPSSVRVYTYFYTIGGNTVEIGTSEGENTIFDTEFYQYLPIGSSVCRLDALKSAVTNFANEVHKKALGKDGQVGGGDDIDHRIALVGFSSPDYNNTELLTGSTINQGDRKSPNFSADDWDGYYYFPTGYEMNGPQYGSISNAQYKAALLPMNTDAGMSGVTAGVNALTAWGGTYTNDGLAMANKIFEQNPITAGEKRNRVVIVFTDGIPGLRGYANSVAQSAIEEAGTAKNTYGATVYTIGVFSGADATSAGSLNTDSDADKGNYFLQRVSSNTQYPQSPSYYLSAADAGTLNNIFQQISDQIESGGSSTTLGSETVIKDIISPSFVLPEGTTADDITLETYACTRMNSNGEYTWSKNADAMGATATITEADIAEEPKKLDQVNVTGFDFSENWCGTVTENGNPTYRGNKLVIKIKVKPRPGFFGGNGVTTNESAGVYKDKDATDAVKTVDSPKVNVPLAGVDVATPGANVYLGAHLNETVDKDKILQDGAQVTIGGYELDFAQGETGNYGLEDWQNAYVNIDTEVTTSGNLTNMTEDAGYTVTVKVTPKTPEGAKGIEDFATGTIHVFKPELTFKDSEVKYMVDTVTNPKYFNANNKVGDEVWKNGDRTDTSDGVTMLTNKPTLALTYTPASGALRADDGLVISPDDIPVAVTVGINGNNVTQYTTFVHQPCTPACGWTNPTTPTTPGDPAFLLHVKDVYADLTIKKTGASVNPDGTGLDAGQSFLFTVTGPDNYSTEVIIVGNGSVTLKNLKIGTYTVTEDTNWSWRYTPTTNNNPQTITLEANKTNTVTINNTRNEDKWLDGNVHKDNKFTGAAATTE